MNKEKVLGWVEQILTDVEKTELDRKFVQGIKTAVMVLRDKINSNEFD